VALPAIQTGTRATDAAAQEAPEPPASAPAPRGDYLSAAAQSKAEVQQPCHLHKPCTIYERKAALVAARAVL